MISQFSQSFKYSKFSSFFYICRFEFNHNSSCNFCASFCCELVEYFVRPKSNSGIFFVSHKAPRKKKPKDNSFGIPPKTKQLLTVYTGAITFDCIPIFLTNIEIKQIFKKHKSWMFSVKTIFRNIQ